MHELSLIKAILDNVCETAHRADAGEICSIHLSVGVLRDFQPDLVQDCFKHFSRGTIAENATLSIETVPLRLRCSICHTVHEIENPWGDVRTTCPEHPTAESVIVSGNELAIRSIEVR